MSRQAQLFVDPVPDLHPDAKRYMIDCKYSTTRMFFIPAGEPQLTDAAIITSLLYRHEAECGQCDTRRLWRHADPELREQTERCWSQLMAQVGLADRKN